MNIPMRRKIRAAEAKRDVMQESKQKATEGLRRVRLEIKTLREEARVKR